MPDIPYQPVIRDRGAERARLDQVPGYSEARQEAAVEFRLLRQLFEARQRAGLTQEQVAVRMGTTRSAISRLRDPASTCPHCPLSAATPMCSAAMLRSSWCLEPLTELHRLVERRWKASRRWRQSSSSASRSVSLSSSPPIRSGCRGHRHRR